MGEYMVSINRNAIGLYIKLFNLAAGIKRRAEGDDGIAI